MIPLRRKLTLKAFKLFDLLVMASAFALATIVTSKHTSQISLSDFLSMRITVQNLLILIGFLIIWQILFSFFGMYRSRRLSNKSKEFVDILKATSTGTIVLWMAGFGFHIEMITPLFLVVFWIASTTVIMSSRLLLRYVLSRIRVRGRNLRFILIVGTNDRAVEFARKIETKPDLGYRLIGFVDEECLQKKEFKENGYQLVTNLKDLPAFVKDHVVDEVVITLPISSYYEDARRIAVMCDEQGIIVRYLSDIFNIMLARPREKSFEGEQLISQYGGAMEEWQVLLKRMLDIIVALFMLLLLAPLLLIVAALVKITSAGPVFFIQERVGLNKRRFRVYKFRTMVADAEEKQSEFEHLNEISGPVFKIKNDPRITWIGRFLRKTSIDEAPQLLNVLEGDMSLVGPRPLPVRDYNGFNLDWHRRRFSIRPGITGLWQVNGRSSISFEKWIEFDMEYIDNWSLLLDLKILFRTIPAVLKGSGAA